MNAEVRAVVITASDRCSRGERVDESGVMLAGLLREFGVNVVASEILPDDLAVLAARLRVYAARADVNLIVTTGGTGLSPRDNTPEATRAVIEKEVPGVAEALRFESLKATPAAMLSRGMCGVLSGALIVNLPGSPAAVRECFAVIKPILSHAVSQLVGRDDHTHE